MAEQEEAHKVILNVYDLSQGLARQLSTSLLGKAIEGIWHTSVCVYGLEYYYSGGIVKAPPNLSAYGTPVKVVDLGSTQVPKALFKEYLDEISPRYTQQTYSLLKHNCNNFSNEITQFLVGTEIPSYILRLPDEVMSSPMAALILPMIQQMETSLRYGGVPQVPHIAPTAPAAAKPAATTTAAIPPAVVMKAPVEDAAQGTSSSSSSKKQALDAARAKVQEEISREFAALMAAGGLRASEAAALATRKVMQKHGIAAGVPPS